jgi:hypothetical protein
VPETEQPRTTGRANIVVRTSGRQLTYTWPPERRGFGPRLGAAAVLVLVAVAVAVLLAAVLFAVLLVALAVAVAALVLSSRPRGGRERDRAQ